MKLLLLPIPFILLRPPVGEARETNGFLVFEIDRVPWHSAGSEIKQKFKVPLTAEFLSNFRHLPSQNSMGTGFGCGGGNPKTSPGGTRLPGGSARRPTIAGASICGAKGLKLWTGLKLV